MSLPRLIGRRTNWRRNLVDRSPRRDTRSNRLRRVSSRFAHRLNLLRLNLRPMNNFRPGLFKFLIRHLAAAMQIAQIPEREADADGADVVLFHPPTKPA